MTSVSPADVFLAEAADLLEQIEQSLLDLHHAPGDRPLIDAVFRGLHTIKGSGAMFGFAALAGFTHHCEQAFERVRAGEAGVTRGLIDIALAAQQHMRTLLDGAAGEAVDAEGAAILARLAAEMDAPVAEPTAETMAADAPAKGSGWHLVFFLPPIAIHNGHNPLALLRELQELGPSRVVALPDRVTVDGRHVGWEVWIETAAPYDAIEDVFLFVADDIDLVAAPLDGPLPDEAPAAAAPAPPPPPAPPVAAAAAPKPASGTPADSIRVPAERLDELMNRVGELVIAQSRLSQLSRDGDLVLRDVAEDIERLASELRDTMMMLRMLPVMQLFGRFRRLVHDLGVETGKDIALSTDGETTEVDKNVVERLADPLVHIIRNACDHGLETAEERIALGKPATGTIRLSARQQGGEVVICIDDDGRGIDKARVRAKAEAQGLLMPGQQLSDGEIFAFIFHPGFSTAETVTNLSGRGVGMDVVKRSIEALRGTIDIASQPGEGTTILLRIPLTLAIIDGLLVRVGDARYVIPLEAVEECVEFASVARSGGRHIVPLRERLIPYVDLRELFGEQGEAPPHPKLVTVRGANGGIGLVVDQIIGTHQTVIKAMSPLHRTIRTFAGATILGDGEIALILDIAQVVALATAREERLVAAA